MCCGSLTFRTSAVRILCDTHVSYALPFLPALVGSHLNLFRTYTICFVPLIQVLPGFYIRLVLWTINIFGNLSPGARIMQFVHSLRYTLISSAIALFYKTLFTPFFVSQLLRFTPVVSHTNLIGAVRNSSLMFLIVLHYETLIKHNRNLSAAKSTYHPCSAETYRKSGALTYPEPLGQPRPVAGHLYSTFTYLRRFVPNISESLLEHFTRFPTVIEFSGTNTLFIIGQLLIYVCDCVSLTKVCPGGSQIFFSSPERHVQTVCGAHPASYSVGSRDFFAGGEAAGAWGWLPTCV